MYSETDLKHQAAIMRLRSRMDISVEAIRDINRFLFAITTGDLKSMEDISEVRDRLGDLEVFLMNK